MKILFTLLLYVFGLNGYLLVQKFSPFWLNRSTEIPVQEVCVNQNHKTYTWFCNNSQANLSQLTLQQTISASRTQITQTPKFSDTNLNKVINNHIQKTHTPPTVDDQTSYQQFTAIPFQSSSFHNLLFFSQTQNKKKLSSLFLDTIQKKSLRPLSLFAEPELFIRQISSICSSYLQTKFPQKFKTESAKLWLETTTAPEEKNFQTLSFASNGDLLVWIKPELKAFPDWINIRIPYRKIKPHILPRYQSYFPPITTNTAPTVDCTKQKCISITFDDGPRRRFSNQLLRILQKHQIPATFFMLGHLVQDDPEITKKIHDLGYEIANHSWNHKNFAQLSRYKMLKQINRTDGAILAATGTIPQFYRPPYGAFKSRIFKLIPDKKMILWHVDPLDWKKGQTSKKIAESVVAQTKQNRIILLHDIYQRTIDAVPIIINTLKKQGYTFVSLSDLLSDK
ncbi:hypothetical protein CSB37_03880 [bacterium DOLZORAL124_38_8]|nr:MAG: hypothetical protein CSB37_03880 [bacterium DOLZORAL124_38_8]